jgi:hypothetical protein
MGWCERRRAKYGKLSLLLLVAGILANDSNDIVPPHDFAALTESFDGGSDFHGVLLWLRWFLGMKICSAKNLPSGLESSDGFSEAVWATVIACGP